MGHGWGMVTNEGDPAFLGVALARLRRGLELTIDELAASAGVHRKTIIQIEAGRVSPRVATLGKIADALGAPLAELLEVPRNDSRPPGGSARATTFNDLWANAVAEHGSRTFLVFREDDGGVTEWTYSTFDTAVSKVAGALAAAGVRAGQAIHVALKNSPAFVAIWLAAARLGAWIVSADPFSPPRDIASQIRRTGARVGVYGDTRARAYEAATSGFAFQAIRVSETAADLAPGTVLTSSGRGTEAHRAKPGDRLVLMFTSGTTSEPKGVELTQANYLQAARSMSESIHLNSTHRWFVTLPIFHGNAHFLCFAPAIAAGASVAMASSFSASQWLAQAHTLRVTHASLFAAPIRMILARSPETAPELALEHVWFAQKLGASHYSEFADLVGTRPRQLYGLTECVSIVSADMRDIPDSESIGRPFPGRQVRLLNPDTGEPVAAGQPGIITVRGTRGSDIFAGYLDDPAKTAESLLRVDGEDWFSTGDLARRNPDGTLQFVGRLDDVIKVAGENVSLTEVEAVLAEAPGVLEVAVVGVEDQIRDRVPVAYLVPRDPNDPPDMSAVAAWADRHLPPAARPRRWHLISELPRTSVGKIRRFQLAQ